jgi:hypothetical protein
MNSTLHAVVVARAGPCDVNVVTMNGFQGSEEKGQCRAWLRVSGTGSGTISSDVAAVGS